MRGVFHVFEMAAHTMTEEGFCRLKTLRVESGMSAEDFADSVILSVADCLDSEQFFVREKSRSCYLPSTC